MLLCVYQRFENERQMEKVCIIKISIVKIKSIPTSLRCNTCCDERINLQSPYERDQKKIYDWNMENMCVDKLNEWKRRTEISIGLAF